MDRMDKLDRLNEMDEMDEMDEMARIEEILGYRGSQEDPVATSEANVDIDAQPAISGSESCIVTQDSECTAAGTSSPYDPVPNVRLDDPTAAIRPHIVDQMTMVDCGTAVDQMIAMQQTSLVGRTAMMDRSTTADRPTVVDPSLLDMMVYPSLEAHGFGPSDPARAVSTSKDHSIPTCGASADRKGITLCPSHSDTGRESSAAEAVSSCADKMSFRDFLDTRDVRGVPSMSCRCPEEGNMDRLEISTSTERTKRTKQMKHTDKTERTEQRPGPDEPQGSNRSTASLSEANKLCPAAEDPDRMVTVDNIWCNGATTSLDPGVSDIPATASETTTLTVSSIDHQRASNNESSGPIRSLLVCASRVREACASPSLITVQRAAWISNQVVREQSIKTSTQGTDHEGILLRRRRAVVSAETAVCDKSTTPSPRHSAFESRLPKEIKVMILQRLLDLWEAGLSVQRWGGVGGGKRELVKLTRVSKSWRALCLDLQLWTHIDFGPLASSLPTESFTSLVRGIAPYVRTLSLRGMDDIPPNYLSTLSDYPSLAHLDLRGCHSVTERDIAHILQRAPKLRVIVAKGVQAFTSGIVRMIASTGLCLETLDIARCRDITFNDLEHYLRNMSPVQAASLRVLKIGGIKPYGRTTTALFSLIPRLTKLEVLDCTGSGLQDEDLRQWVVKHDSEGTPSTLVHLIISSCSRLTPLGLRYLTGTIPQVEILEMAGMGRMFRDVVDEETIPALLRTLPKLRKVDLEGTGEWGGVGDEVLRVLEEYAVEEVRVGDAKAISQRAFSLFARKCGSLRVFEVDNTRAHPSLLNDFSRSGRSVSASDASDDQGVRDPNLVQGGIVLSMLDCPSVTTSTYNTYSANTRPRSGWTGYASTPFGYGSADFSRPSQPAQPAGPVQPPATARSISFTRTRQSQMPSRQRVGYRTSDATGRQSGRQVEPDKSDIFQTMWGWRRIGVQQDWRIMRDRARAGLVDGGQDGHSVLSAGRGPRKRRGSWWGDEEGCVVM